VLCCAVDNRAGLWIKLWISPRKYCGAAYFPGTLIP
jgi:hypothetical protein